MEPAPFDSLISLLHQECAIYREMALLLEEEREAMLAMAAERLGEIVSRKETLALRIKALDESRKVLARRLGAQCALQSDNVTVSTLAERADAPTARRLREAGAHLRAVVEQCRAISAHNARAAHHGLELVAGVIEQLISQADPAGQVYQQAKTRPVPYGALRRSAGGPGFISRQV